MRQGNFVGAGVNTVTRSGTNQFRGSVYYRCRDNEPGRHRRRKGLTVQPRHVRLRQLRRLGCRARSSRTSCSSSAATRTTSSTQPGTTFRANTGGETVGGNVTRVLASDLDALERVPQVEASTTTPAPTRTTTSRRRPSAILGKLDYNLNNRNKVSFRYNAARFRAPTCSLSNSSSLGFGNRRTQHRRRSTSQNSNYAILENIKSGVGEWNSIIGANMANTLIVGLHARRTRAAASRGRSLLPDGGHPATAGTVYTSFGFEPFTPEQRAPLQHVPGRRTTSPGTATSTRSRSARASSSYHSDNVFFPGSQSVYVYNSLADFYTDANDYLANPNRTTSPVTLRRFQVRWNNIPGLDEAARSRSTSGTAASTPRTSGRPTRNLKVTLGLRVDVPSFGDTGYRQRGRRRTDVPRRERQPRAVRRPASCPDAKLLWSPRVGFNWDVAGDRTTQVRGGTGVFTGPPPYVWISNQIGNTGVLTGFDQLDNTTARPFNPNPDAYKPTNVTGAPAAELRARRHRPELQVPAGVAQQHRARPAAAVGPHRHRRVHLQPGRQRHLLHQRQPAGARRRASSAPTTGRAGRPTASTPNVTTAIVLKNQNDGYSWNVSASLEKRVLRRFVRQGRLQLRRWRRTRIDAGSIASGSWTGNPISGDPNNPAPRYSGNALGDRFFLALSMRLDT